MSISIVDSAKSAKEWNTFKALSDETDDLDVDEKKHLTHKVITVTFAPQFSELERTKQSKKWYEQLLLDGVKIKLYKSDNENELLIASYESEQVFDYFLTYISEMESVMKIRLLEHGEIWNTPRYQAESDADDLKRAPPKREEEPPFEL